MRALIFAAFVTGSCLFFRPELGLSFSTIDAFEKPNLVLTQGRGRGDDFNQKPKAPPILGSTNRSKSAKSLNSTEKSKARKILQSRSVWQHFAAIDSNSDKHLGYKEMVHYFSEMHTVFDQNGDGLVSRREAPPIMLRYTLSGKSFPAGGLSKAEIARRFKALFRLVDKNKDGRMSVMEML